MNSIQLENTLKNIYAQYANIKYRNNHYTKEQDMEVLDFLIRLFHITELDSEEIIPLWVEYLNKGNLNIAGALHAARKRIVSY